MCKRRAEAFKGMLYRHDWQLAILLGVAILLVAGIALWPRKAPSVTPAPASISAADLETAQDRSVIVYVNGAVRNPGLYPLSSGLRVVDAIVAAGGMTAEADPACLPNLAAHLKDAKQITVPFAGHCARGAKKIKLDINSASRAQLLAVAGMDPALADAIIAYREQNGGFQSLTELKSGLGLDSMAYKQLAKSLAVP
ncbi:MAG: ComEA family DNA-binding protein [Candidatus Dormibacteraeota bacterium]|nr:ComEA family DNA-binding protein [Candidatus Dormibacteraeota bacterium]